MDINTLPTHFRLLARHVAGAAAMRDVIVDFRFSPPHGAPDENPFALQHFLKYQVQQFSGDDVVVGQILHKAGDAMGVGTLPANGAVGALTFKKVTEAILGASWEDGVRRIVARSHQPTISSSAAGEMTMDEVDAWLETRFRLDILDILEYLRDANALGLPAEREFPSLSKFITSGAKKLNQQMGEVL